MDDFDVNVYLRAATPALDEINAQIADAQRSLRQLRERRNSIIARAMMHGASPTRLSRLVGLSRQQIYEIA